MLLVEALGRTFGMSESWAEVRLLLRELIAVGGRWATGAKLFEMIESGSEAWKLFCGGRERGVEALGEGFRGAFSA